MNVATKAPARNKTKCNTSGSTCNKTTFPDLESRRAEHLDDVVLPVLVNHQALEPQLLRQPRPVRNPNGEININRPRESDKRKQSRELFDGRLLVLRGIDLLEFLIPLDRSLELLWREELGFDVGVLLDFF